MMGNFDRDRCPSRVLSAAMLDAWLCGDRPRLRRRLHDIRCLREQAIDDTERERLEILKVMAYAMTETADLFASRASDPRLGSWLDLLDHFASSGVAPD